MRLSQLTKPKKPDAQLSGFGGSSEVLPVAEAEVKAHQRADLPERVHLSKSFYMEQRFNGDGWVAYAVLQFLNDTPVATVTMIETPGKINSDWMLEPNKKFFPDYAGDGIRFAVSRANLYNVLKLKWWVTNRLIELGALPSMGK